MNSQNIRPEALSKILLIQNMLGSLPDAEAMLSFTCRGLEDLPGVRAARHDAPVEDAIRFPVHMGDHTYATIYCTVENTPEFAHYQPYVHNICFMIAARLEEKRQRRRDADYQKQLQDEVDERTRDMKQARAHAEEERARAEKYLEISEAIVVELDTGGIVERINQRGASLLGYEQETVVGSDWFKLAIPDDQQEVRRQAMRNMPTRPASGEEYGDHEIVTRTAGRRILHWHTVVRTSADGTILGVLASGQDVTERRTAELEKEILLKEVYHRTKNNMHVISNLLALQAAATDDTRLHRSFADAQNRILSMALVHTMLYSSDTITHLNLNHYISKLADNILSAYPVGPDPIDVVVSGDQIPVTLDTAVPCGLVLNEIIVNSGKHAFDADATDPRVAITIRRHPGSIEITCRDNGRGFPPDFDSHSTGRLGMQIIHNVTEQQLQGTLTMHTNGGAEVKICIADVSNGS